MKNKFNKGNICEEYCHPKCETCNNTKNDCVTCANFYMKDKNGECVMENNIFTMIGRGRGFFNVLKRRGLKTLFMALDDLWLYNYHKKQYDGTTLAIF